MIRLPLIICLGLSIFHQAFSQNMQKKNYTYLALGDSYTIGESLPLQDNFPNQTVQLLKDAGFYVEQPTIVAKTGWTGEELQWGIGNRVQQKAQYDIVSLLIGVNNQYRGGDLEEYAKQFEELVQKAVQFAGNKATHVYVLSIPDWGATPYAEGKDRATIAKEIDGFNQVNKTLSEKWKVNYINITPGSRQVAVDQSLIAADGLHPSAKEYKRWAEKLATAIQQQFH
ncbi:MAG: SGNH/GDSL hydrolase family protein [Chitinophagaceae bacterium]|nr:SGNH/GDSL hydrolase family protein [Chitinophagaceae bacterium]